MKLRVHGKHCHKQKRGGPGWALIGGLAALVLVVTMGGVNLITDKVNQAGPGGAGDSPATESWPRWGMTHTQYSADDGEPQAMRNAQHALAAQPLIQNQHIMGWGVGNPEPAPDVYDFSDLDDRMALIRRSGGTPVITLCCAPDWMKGGQPGETDWSKLEEAPLPKHYDEFAELAATVARRYPQVRHFIVWNEMKGFFDEEHNRWNYEGYTKLYNLVYDALKAVDPAIRVGGPYVVIDSHSPGQGGYPSMLRGPWGSVDQRSLDVINYWLEHKHGADFLVVDSSTYTRDGELIPDEFAATGKLSAVGRWLRPRTDLPVWWGEWYVEPDGSRWSEKHRLAVQAVAMMELVEGGATTALYWNPQRPRGDCPGCLWTPTLSNDGGQPLPMLSLLQGFARWFPSGTRLEEVTASSPVVRVLAQPLRAVVVNTTDVAVTARVDGQRLHLDGYEVCWLDRTATPGMATPGAATPSSYGSPSGQHQETLDHYDDEPDQQESRNVCERA